jgi:hypothetical protein
MEGYVWGSEPLNPNYFPNTGYEYNSAGGRIQILRHGIGRYQVRFYDMAGRGGVAHVSAYGSDKVCSVASWGPSEGDEVVYLRCFATGTGAAADTRFIVHVTNRTDGPARGYLLSSDPMPPAGGYELTFPKAAATGGHAFASIMGTPPMYCVIQSWFPIGNHLRVLVRCYGPGGAPSPGAVLNVGFFT